MKSALDHVTTNSKVSEINCSFVKRGQSQFYLINRSTKKNNVHSRESSHKIDSGLINRSSLILI